MLSGLGFSASCPGDFGSSLGMRACRKVHVLTKPFVAWHVQANATP